MTSSTETDHSDHPPAIVSSESVDRQERGDPYGTNHHPATVSSENVERQERGDPYSSETSEELLNKPTKTPKPKIMIITSKYGENNIIPTYREWLQEFRENLVDDRVPEHRDTHASSSHDSSLEPTRSADLGKHSVFFSSRMLVLQVREWIQIWEKCSYAHRQVDEQPSKRSKKNGD